MTLLIRREPDSLAITWAFSTDVIKARSGLEKQRIANRDRPLETIALSFNILGDPADTDPELAELRAALFTDAVSAIEIPLRMDGRPSVYEMTGTAATIDATHADWPAVDQLVYIEGATPDDFYTTAITGTHGLIGSLEMSLADSPPGGMSFPAGVTTISPIATVLASDRTPLARFQADHGQIRISGVITNTWAAYGTGASLTSHNGLTVLDEPPVTDSDLFEEQFDGAIEREESLAGHVVQTSAADFSDIARLHNFDAEGEAERQWWRLFLATVRGRQKAFRLPTWRPDLVHLGNSGPTLTIEAPPAEGAIDYVNDYWPSAAHRCLMLARTDGTRTYYTVTAATDNLDGTADLTLNTTVNPTDLDFISLVETCRLSDDSVTFVYGATSIDLAVQALVVQQPALTSPSTFDDYQESIQSSAPVDLFKIVGTGVAYYMTSGRAAVTYGGNTYTPSAISRGEIAVASQGDNDELIVNLPVSETLVQEQAFGIPSPGLTVTVYRQNAGGTEQIWSGPISGFSVKGTAASFRSPSYLDDPLLSSIPSAYYQARICNHRLYGAACGNASVTPAGPVRADFDLSTTIVSVDVSTIVVASVTGLTDVGEILHSNGERRMVLAQSGTTLTITGPFKNAAALDSVTLYEKCNRTIEECRTKFNNVANFGGQPRIPGTSPFHFNIWGQDFR